MPAHSIRSDLDMKQTKTAYQAPTPAEAKGGAAETKAGVAGAKTAKAAGTSEVCGRDCEVFSRVVGYFRPVQNWNLGKQQEFRDRKTYSVEKGLRHQLKSAPKDTQRATLKGASKDTQKTKTRTDMPNGTQNIPKNAEEHAEGRA